MGGGAISKLLHIERVAATELLGLIKKFQFYLILIFLRQIRVKLSHTKKNFVPLALLPPSLEHLL